MPEKYNVVGTSDSFYESMTKEEIIAAIVEAVEGGTVGDIDTGFVTILKEINKNIGIRLWVGTTAEYNALLDKPDNVIYIKTDDTTAEDINTALELLQQNIEAIGTALQAYAPESHAYSTTKYGAATSSDYGHVKLITSLTTAVAHPDGTAMRGDLAYSIGQRFTTIEQVTTDTGWQAYTGNYGTGWSASTTRPLKYRKIGNHVYLRGDIIAGSTTPSSQPITAPYDPATAAYKIISTNTSTLFVSITIGTNATVINADMSTLQSVTVHIDLDYFTD